LGRNVGIRIVQATAEQKKDFVALEELGRMVRWLDDKQLHVAILESLKLGFISGRIGMMTGTLIFSTRS
jgi:hypothetical protein